MGIRNSAKALIFQDGNLLAIKKQDKDGFYYILPGGGQEHGETLHETLRRECIEEINALVDIGDLLFIREYIGRNHERAEFDSGVHQIEYMFLCNIKKDNKDIRNGIVPDDGQIGVEWLPIPDLISYRLYPQELRKYIMDYKTGISKNTTVYLGDIN
ncbi:NUDIX domain-containing protein [Ornithinibacillus halophilus]|uniref:ADP-ribose pyrophosphatase YjhB, NUDIX family n=1 Tax=Ornithinibacillus halophilus TaxID=930117 RepID=A0A1M5E1E9_9BACI|nr:NUDIX domain-containing protein [Ornithinibacillus halophilus]SHF72891.1 ADP-ribose pyrophosphatase YjhB, NUDIX family [Ornithinibacillus halophilus]